MITESLIEFNVKYSDLAVSLVFVVADRITASSTYCTAEGGTF